MISLVSRALEPNTSHNDKLLYIASLGLHQSVSSTGDKNTSLVTSIQNLIASSQTRLHGLQALEIALQQNPTIFALANWTEVIFGILRDAGAPILKDHACSVLCLLIPLFAKDCNPMALKSFKKEVVPFLMDKSDGNTQWSVAACKCLYACIKFLPQAVYSHVNRIEEIILKHVANNISSKAFEIYAMCFSELPYCSRDSNCQSKDKWREYYLRTLKTMQVTLSSFFSLIVADWNDPSCDGAEELEAVEEFKFKDDEDKKKIDGFSHPMKGVRRFANLCRCLAKMLSLKSKGCKGVPIKETFYCLAPILETDEKLSTHNAEKEVFFSTLAQMQIAACSIIESMLLNLKPLQLSGGLCKLLSSALKSSKLGIASENIGELRLVVWKLLETFAGRCGCNATSSICNPEFGIIDELLHDITIAVKESSQSTTPKANQKSKSSNMPVHSENKRNCTTNQHLACSEALKTLEMLLYVGTSSINLEVYERIEQKMMQVLKQLKKEQRDYPFPYDSETCRKNLYSVLVAIIVISRPNRLIAVQTATAFFRSALADSSTKVIRMCHKGLSICSLSLHPNRPSPEVVNKPRISKVSSVTSAVKYSEWDSEDYLPNLPVEDMSDTPEAAASRVGQSYHSAAESERHSEEYMDVQQHYSEHDLEIQCNGEEVLIQDAQSSSQCQDDDSEDEDEEDDDERSYGEEEMNLDEVHSENMYIPSSSKLQVLNPAHTNPETAENVIEAKYEELRPCTKTEGDIVDNSNKNMHLNGVHNIVPDVDVPCSSSQQTVANENGVFELEDDDLEEEEDEEDEEENVSFPAEKKVAEFYDPPLKRQKLDTDEANEELENEEREQNSKSPTLAEMKADFCINDIEDVKS